MARQLIQEPAVARPRAAALGERGVQRMSAGDAGEYGMAQATQHGEGKNNSKRYVL
ncbi:hypothetical protein ACOTEY_02645 [Achromobacter xylosoxidans]